MPSISQLESKGTTFLIFGGFGTGKTHFASTLPQPIYFFDTDRGLKTVVNRLKNAGKLDEANIDYDIFFDPPFRAKKRSSIVSGMKSVLSEINPSPDGYLDFENKLDEIVNNEEIKYRTVVIDSLSSLGVIFTNYIMYTQKDQGRIFGLPNQSDMGNFIRKMPELISMFHFLADRGIITVCIAHMQIKEQVIGPKGKEEYFGTYRTPNFIGKSLPFEIGRFFDEVYHSYVDNPKGGEARYMFRTRSSSDIHLKSRSSKMPDTIPQDWSVVSKVLGIHPTRGHLSDEEITVGESEIAKEEEAQAVRVGEKSDLRR